MLLHQYAIPIGNNKIILSDEANHMLGDLARWISCHTQLFYGSGGNGIVTDPVFYLSGNHFQIIGRKRQGTRFIICEYKFTWRPIRGNNFIGLIIGILQIFRRPFCWPVPLPKTRPFDNATFLEDIVEARLLRHNVVDAEACC